MAAQGGNLKWQERFPKHAIFREISQTVVEEKSSLTGDSQCRTIKNILIENDGEIFVWNSHRKVLLTANLKNLHFQNERADKFQVSSLLY